MQGEHFQKAQLLQCLEGLLYVTKAVVGEVHAPELWTPLCEFVDFFLGEAVVSQPHEH